MASPACALALAIVSLTAHYMCHRIRAALTDPEFRRLVGIVEIDETYVGGKNRNRHWDKRRPGTGGANKFTVAGAVERKGNVVARVIEKADSATVDSFIAQAIGDKVSPFATDEGGQYTRLSKIAPHRFVTHGRGQYVDGIVHSDN